jgi:hypothetical protein
LIAIRIVYIVYILSVRLYRKAASIVELNEPLHLPNMEIAQEEVFGPVAPIIIVDDEKEAIRIANDSKFGLGAYGRRI